MIAWLQGRIIDKSHPGKLILDVNGVGYDVDVSLTTFFQVEHVQSLLALHIHTIVREDALLLYGFYDTQERALFRALIKVNGVGPKLAMTILSSITPHEFTQCIVDHDATRLTKLPGIGKKTAERLVIEMKDSVQQLPHSGIQQKQWPTLNHQAEAISALEALGYTKQEASKVIRKIDDGERTSEQLIRQALQMLSQLV